MNELIQKNLFPKEIIRIDKPKIPNKKLHTYVNGYENVALDVGGINKHKLPKEFILTPSQRKWLEN